ncbi:MAG: hypothetical protein ACI802_001452, partial [Candidatus Paceibacteria bacterium]
DAIVQWTKVHENSLKFSGLRLFCGNTAAKMTSLRSITAPEKWNAEGAVSTLSRRVLSIWATCLFFKLGR